HDDRRLEAGLAPHPVSDLPFVDREGERRAQFRILIALAARLERIEDTGFDPVEIEVLLAGGVEVAGPRPARRRPRSPARGERRRLRERIAFDVTVARPQTVGL